MTRGRPSRAVALVWMVFVLLNAMPAGAVRPDEMLADPVLEARAREIGAELRCLVCRNQSIDDSDADLAHDLRVLVRERLSGAADLFFALRVGCARVVAELRMVQREVHKTRKGDGAARSDLCLDGRHSTGVADRRAIGLFRSLGHSAFGL